MISMTAPLADAWSLGDNARLALAIPVGFAFGFALERAGLGSARKLVGQFLLTDLTVFKVMFSAIVTAMLGVFWLARLGLLQLPLVYVPETFLLPQLVGGLIFGVGFAVGGLCPGTACVAMASGRGDGLAAFCGIFSGVLVTGLGLGSASRFYESTARGTLTLPALMELPYGTVVFLVVLLALAGFAAAERIERRPQA